MKPVMNFLAKLFAKNNTKNVIASAPDPDFLPYSVHYDRRTVLTKNGELMQFIKVIGFNNTSIYADLIPLREAVRDAIRNNIKKTNFALWFSTIRRKKDISSYGEFNDFLSNKINQTWEDKNNLRDDFINELYITVIIEGLDSSISNFKSFFRSFSKISTLALHKEFLKNSCEELTKVTQGILANISDYGARMLEINEWEGVMYSEPMSFLGKICNLQDKDFPVSISDISEDLSDNKVIFTNRQVEIIGNNEHHFGAILSLKEYIELDPESLDKILQLPFEFVITQSFDFSYNESELEFYKYQDNILRISNSQDFRDLMGLSNFFESVEGTVTDYGKLQTTMMVIANSGDDLNYAIKKIIEKFHALGLVVIREDVFIEDCFWAQLPGNFKFLKRQKIINSYRVAGFGSLYSFDSGVIDGNYWGSAVTTFKTINNNPYFFNFHDGDNGHGLFIGGEYSGKTVLINFLLAQARRYNNKIFYVDFDNKAQNFIELLGGFYYKLSTENNDKRNLKINPFSEIDGDEKYQKFLTEFIYSLIYHSIQDISPQEIQLIGEYVNKILINKICNFSEAINVFNNDKTKNIFAILKNWNESNLLSIFNHNKEINWNDRIMGFDLSLYKDKEVITTPILYYLLYKIENILDGKVPAILVLKDANFLLKSSIFYDKISDILDRLRQKNCLVLFSINSINIVDESDFKLLKLIETKVASKFILKNAINSPQILQTLDLNDQELFGVKNFEDKNKKFLLKFGEDSVVINFDFSDHKALLRLLSSRPEDIAIVEEIYNYAQQEGKVIDIQTVVNKFTEVIEVLEQDLIQEQKRIERERKVAKMKKLRELED